MNIWRNQCTGSIPDAVIFNIYITRLIKTTPISQNVLFGIRCIFKRKLKLNWFECHAFNTLYSRTISSLNLNIINFIYIPDKYINKICKNNSGKMNSNCMALELKKHNYHSQYVFYHCLYLYYHNCNFHCWCYYTITILSVIICLHKSLYNKREKKTTCWICIAVHFVFSCYWFIEIPNINILEREELVSEDGHKVLKSEDWREGRKVVELGVLADGLLICIRLS